MLQQRLNCKKRYLPLALVCFAFTTAGFLQGSPAIAFQDALAANESGSQTAADADPQEEQQPAGDEQMLDLVRAAMGQAAGIGLPDRFGRNEEVERLTPEPLTHYLGREIAMTMSYHGGGAEWLIREEREREERCSMMLVNLGLRRGMAICDMGCGVGFHTIPMAQLVGENGFVVGVDVQPEMLVALRDRAEQLGIENVIPILGSYHDPRLPPDSLDLVLMVDVYHEFSHPEEMLRAIRRSLKPDGQVVLLEYRAEDPTVPIKPLHKMSKEQIDREMVANGFKLTQEFDDLPWQHMVFYGIDEEFDADR
ncbi:MAG: class I SAM-dependent methyltransferase [Planctomycetota bacterium]